MSYGSSECSTHLEYPILYLDIEPHVKVVQNVILCDNLLKRNLKHEVIGRQKRMGYYAKDESLQQSNNLKRIHTFLYGYR